MVSKLPWLYWLKTAIPACIDLFDDFILKGTIVPLEVKKWLGEKQLLETPGSCRGLKIAYFCTFI